MNRRKEQDSLKLIDTIRKDRNESHKDLERKSKRQKSKEITKKFKEL